jgi:PAS domain S-box-containing protein
MDNKEDWFYRKIIENSQDAIILADVDGVIKLWNSGAVNIFGHTADDALGETLDIIIPDRFRDSHWTGFNEVMSTGITKYQTGLLAVPAIRKDGTRISIEFTILMLKDEQDTPLGIAATIRDVTKRRQQDRDMQERVSNLEEQLKQFG